MTEGCCNVGYDALKCNSESVSTSRPGRQVEGIAHNNHHEDMNLQMSNLMQLDFLSWIFFKAPVFIGMDLRCSRILY
jgi:hypothetical protein